MVTALTLASGTVCNLGHVYFGCGLRAVPCVAAVTAFFPDVGKIEGGPRPMQAAPPPSPPVQPSRPIPPEAGPGGDRGDGRARPSPEHPPPPDVMRGILEQILARGDVIGSDDDLG